MKETFTTAMGIAGGILGALIGGWDSALTTLVLFMVIDYITGLIVAGVFKNSAKTESGALSSDVGFRGICKKGVMLLVVMVGYRVDLTTGTTIIKDAVVMAFIGNELISFTENLGLMGVPLPKALSKAIEVLKNREV
ncbi:MAG: holin family protein [Anaerotignaceae bacterium]